MAAEQVHINPWFQVTLTRTGGHSWYRVRRPDSAMLIGSALDGRILLLRGTRDTTGPQPLYEFPCGVINDGESPSQAAARETAEESGYAVEAVELLGRFIEVPGISPAVCHVFTATLLKKQDSRLEPGEDWTPVLTDERRLRALVADGHIQDAGTLAAIALRAIRTGASS